jgi:hypothetical protein
VLPLLAIKFKIVLLENEEKGTYVVQYLLIFEGQLILAKITSLSEAKMLSAVRHFAV